MTTFRRAIAALVLLGALCSPLAAQNLLEFGVKAGTNHTFPNSLSDGIESTDNFGWQVGGFFQVGLFDLVALGTELTVDRRSFTLTRDAASIDVSTTSVNIPVLLRIGLPLKLMLELGPQYTHYVSSTDATTTDGQGFAVIGLIWKPAFGLQFDLRYLRGLSTISTSFDGDVNVNVTQFSVGYAF
jgi:hypothetical protein